MKATAELKMLPVSVLKPAAYNPRKKLKPGDKEYEKIKNSITEFGFADPLVVNADMTIIGGHQRLTVAMELGYTEVPCAVVDIDKTREKALNIALNKITGAWDDSLLADLLKDIEDSIWEYDRPKSNKDHPTMKPIGLMSYPIRNSTMTNGIVLDPFLGSGSTLIACEETDRVCRGIELDPKFVDVIVKRYIEHSEGHYDDVYVIRDSQKLKFEEVATFEPEREVADGE